MKVIGRICNSGGSVGYLEQWRRVGGMEGSGRLGWAREGWGGREVVGPCNKPPSCRPLLPALLPLVPAPSCRHRFLALVFGPYALVLVGSHHDHLYPPSECIVNVGLTCGSCVGACVSGLGSPFSLVVGVSLAGVCLPLLLFIYFFFLDSSWEFE